VAFTAQDTNLTPSRVEKLAATPPRTEIWQGNLSTSRQAVSSLVDIPEGYKITKIILGIYGASLANTVDLFIHTADAAAGKSITGVSTGIINTVDIEGWFDDLWVSASSGTPASWLEVQIKPGR